MASPNAETLPPLPSTARVVIIGGGAVGVSTLYHLALEGWTDCLLLEKTELTAGSTWHAAGKCPNFSTSAAVLRMQAYSTALYRELADRVDYPMNYHVSGALRLSHSKERTQEFQHVQAMARAQGVEMDVLPPEEAYDTHYPYLELHDLHSVMWDATDGDNDPAQLTQALAKGARDLGAKIARYTPAIGVRRDGDEWVVETERGEVRCDHVVNAAGYYAARVAEWFKPFGGRSLPMVVMSHQYMLTEEVTELKDWLSEKGTKMPMIRDPDSSYYLRQEKTGMNLGPYERNCKAHWVDPSDPMPQDFSFQLYPDDLDRLEWYIEDAMARVPLLGTSGVSRVINGPIPYAPDGLPLIGPMPGVTNAYEACVFTFGIAQAGGAGKLMADWIVHGQPEWDAWPLDPRRYTGYADADYARVKGMEVYGHEYAMHFPHACWPAGRDKRLSPNHATLLAEGAQMGAYGGWERATWFARTGDDTTWESTQTWDRAGPWKARVAEECAQVRDHAGIIDLTGFSRFRLSGDGAAEWLCGRIAGALPKVGRLNLGYFADQRGRVETEMSVTRHGEDDFTLTTAAAAEWHDWELLSRDMPAGVTLTNRTEQSSTVLLTGPAARNLLGPLAEADLMQPWMSHQFGTVAGQEAHLARVSFAGELGWEIQADRDGLPAIYAALRKAGAQPFGMYALDAMRIEKGYKTWKGDLSSDYTLFEAGLERFVRLDKVQDFPGRQALLKEKQVGPAKTSLTLVVDAGPQDALPMSPIWAGDEIVGEATSSTWGHRVGQSIALGVVRADAVSEPLTVDIFGQRRPAQVASTSALWDPENLRLRA
ncbi:MAG: FAD-dependent oxidoreductase [Pseudomonadota bacterium]